MSAVNLTKRVEVGGGRRFCPVVRGRNGRVRPDYVHVGDREEHHPEGIYYIEWRVNGQRRRKAVGTDATEADNACLRQEQLLASGEEGVVKLTEREDNRDLRTAVKKYLADIEDHKKGKTHAAYSTALDYFLETCRQASLDDITRDDILAFTKHLRSQGLSDRSVYNNFLNVRTFLKAHGVTREMMGLQKNDTPKYTKKKPNIYDSEELDGFFKVCSDEERVIFKFFLNTGEREQEVQHAYWSDINFNRSTIRVTAKPEPHKWSPKDYEEREIPVNTETLDLLKKWKAERKDSKCPLLFPTKRCQIEGHFLRKCKDVAKRAGLNQNDFNLHKFRRTFGTWHLRNGVDLATVQAWMGHSDLASTMRYLRPSEHDALRDKIEVFGKAASAGS